MKKHEISIKIGHYIAVIYGIYVLYAAVLNPLSVWYDRGLHLCSMLMIVFLTTSWTKKPESENPVLFYINMLLVAVVIAIISYMMIDGDNIILRLGKSNIWDIMVTWTLIILIIEGVRRAVGVPLMIITILFVGYLLFAPHITGYFRTPNYSQQLIATHMFNTMRGLLSAPIGVSATVVIMFVIFGSFLLKSGGGDFFSDLAFAMTGRYIGGAAKASCVASAFFGMINGSPAANSATTGVFTIPLMKKCGYTPEFAAAVEATSSTGGMYLPPVMGASAFIMAELTNTPYVKIATIALIPALIYYIIIYLNIHLEAKRLDLSAKEEVPPILPILKRGIHYLISIGVLIYTLIIGWSPSRVAFCAIASLVVVSWFRKDTRMGPKEIIESIKAGILNTRLVALACGAAALMMGVLSVTGLGLKVSTSIVSLSGGVLFITLILTAVSSIILGMGSVSVTSYLLVAVLISPALVTLGKPVILSHLFAYFYAMAAGITPPIAVVVYITAAIAGANQFRSALKSITLSMTAYIIPFLFMYNQKFLLGFKATVPTVLFYAISLLVALAYLSFAARGYLYNDLSTIKRVTYLILGTVMLVSIALDIPWLIIVCLLTFLVVTITPYVKDYLNKTKKEGFQT